MGVFLAPGTRLNGYIVRDSIATGGEGSTYLAEDGKGRKCALKQHRESVSDARRRDSIERVRRLRALVGQRHPNVCEILDVFEHADLLYEVMAYVDGESLQALIEKRGPMSPSAYCPIHHDVLSGLAWLHEKGIVHRDVKPANIVVRDDAGKGHAAKLVDLSIALHTALPRVTHKPVIMGTLEFAPVEVILSGEGEVDCRADLYSAGATMFHALTGELPFPEAVPDKLLKRLVQPERPSMRGVVPAISEALDDHVQRLMALEPEDRPSTAEQAWAEFKGVVADAPRDGDLVAAKSTPATVPAGPTCLLIASGDFAGKTFPVPRCGIALGRSLINPSDALMSRFHLRAKPKRNGILLRDLGSRNGLLRGKRRLRKVLLRRGEEITIGETILKHE